MGPSDTDWVPPESFDEYRLVKALGRGSIGQVWLAHDTVLDRLVAVKFIAELPADEAARQRFLTEARAAARVQHPNIVAVYRVGEIGPRPYLSSEYVQGASLDTIARPVAWPRLLEIAIGLARGLAAAHRQGILHRDLKPANAILSQTGEVKLLDFGLAKLLPHVAPLDADAPPGRDATAVVLPAPGDPTLAPGAASEPSLSPPDSSSGPVTPSAEAHAGPSPAPRLASGRLSSVPSTGTSTGAVVGTPAYVAPEVWRGEPATQRSDVYSFGAMLYELGAGTPPHGGGSLEAVRRSTLDHDPPLLAVAVPGIDPGLAAVVDRCLRRDPAGRFSSGVAVRAALEALTASDRPAAGSPAQPRKERPPPGPRQLILLGAALGLALALARFAHHRLGGKHAPAPGDAVVTRSALPDPPGQRRPDTPAIAASAVPESCPEGMVPVPAGTFQMGSPKGEGDEDEHPQHEVTLSAYCIDRTEVTVAAYAECVDARACGMPPLTVNSPNYSANELEQFSRWCNGKDRPDHPVNCVDWEQAVAYCRWKGKRLPTEAEWEYAARGGDGRIYPWGNEAPSAKRLNACGSECALLASPEIAREARALYDGDDGWATTAPVGSYPEGASPSGALDMAGNVAEWTADWYGVYSAQAETNPQGARAGMSRVSRGGGWFGTARAADREWPDPAVRAADRGFRCALGH